MRTGLIAAPGYPFLLGALALMLLGWLLGWRSVAFLGLLGAVFFAYFFRDPDRPIPQDAKAIVSPADGKVIIVDEVPEGEGVGGAAQRLGIFMNVFDVHVNRAPVAGRVSASQHRSGRFLAAFRQEAEEVNEQQLTLLDNETGQVKVVQIAGLLARRIVPFVKPGDRLARGQRLGMICFGSRVDLHLPKECIILVRKGARVKAGSTIVARWP